MPSVDRFSLIPRRPIVSRNRVGEAFILKYEVLAARDQINDA
jgi:hypothetical protein